jgi:hypothetical protein
MLVTPVGTLQLHNVVDVKVKTVYTSTVDVFAAVQPVASAGVGVNAGTSPPISNAVISLEIRARLKTVETFTFLTLPSLKLECQSS